MNREMADRYCRRPECQKVLPKSAQWRYDGHRFCSAFCRLKYIDHRIATEIDIINGTSLPRFPRGES